MSKLSLTKIKKKTDSPRTPCRPANRPMDSSANSSPYELCMFDSPLYEDSTAGMNWVSSNDASPVIITMSQRALTLGCDVTWVDSPKRRTTQSTSTPKHITDQENEKNHTSPTTTASMVMRRQNHRPKQIFKPTSPNQQQLLQQQPKKGIHKFMENVRKLRMQECSNQQEEQKNIKLLNTQTTSTSTTTSTSEGSNSSSSINYNLLENTSTNDLLSKSIQNEFLNDSDFDIELIISSQEAEARLKKNEQTNNSSSNTVIFSSPISSKSIEAINTDPPVTTPTTTAKQSNWQNFLELDDSIDDYMVSKEIDEIILTQSSTTITNSSISLERHKSMPPHSNNQQPTTTSTSMVGNSNSKIFERHNSLPNNGVPIKNRNYNSKKTQ